MKHKLTEAIVKKLSAPTDTISRIFYDSEIRGFGCRVTANIMRNLLMSLRLVRWGVSMSLVGKPAMPLSSPSPTAPAETPRSCGELPLTSYA